MVIRGEGEQGEALRVFKGIPDVEIPQVRRVVDLVVPRDAFAHGRSDVTVTLVATLLNGDPLPEWLKFDPIKGHFQGDVPEGFADEITIRVIATDNTGATVETIFRIRIVEAEKQAPIGKASLTRQLAEAGRAMRLGERDALLAKMRGGESLVGHAVPLRGQKV